VLPNARSPVPHEILHVDPKEIRLFKGAKKRIDIARLIVIDTRWKMRCRPEGATSSTFRSIGIIVAPASSRSLGRCSRVGEQLNIQRFWPCARVWLINDDKGNNDKNKSSALGMRNSIDR